MFRPHPARRTLLRAVLVLVGVLPPVAQALAAEEAPDALVQSVAADVLKIISGPRAACWQPVQDG
jgi:hypothetical protein